MGEDAGEGSSAGAPGEGPGALSRLLEELARAPHADADGAWAKALRPGDVLDRFEILRELGRGGFGAVYEALDRELGRRVALKTLRPGRSRDEWADEQLRTEARAAASLSHPGIVTLHEACTCDRGPYLVMELLRGETLESRLARGPLPLAEAVEVGLQMARALAHVHGHGLVHRDLKPGNVFLGEDGRVKLLDLGLAHLLGRKSSTGGTPAYVAPEQWRGEEVDGRADVFALGAVLFEMVSGRRAFEVREERSSALDAGPAPALPGKVPRGLARLVARCLSKEPSGRPTAAQAAEELLGIQRGQARPRVVRRVGMLVGAGVAVGVAVALFALQTGRKGGGTSPDGRVVVAVADVVNETGERELDVLSGLLVTSLEQSRKLSVMTQARVLDLAIRAGRKDAARVDETIGREVGAAHGVRALLLPAIRKLGGTYSLEMRAVDPTRDEHLFTLADRATSKEGLLDLLDRLSERTRTELGEKKTEVVGSSVELGQAMTRSLDAYQHYLTGLEAWLRDGQRAVGLREFEEALRLDPGFAAAHVQIASLLHNSYSLPGLAESHWKAADAGLDRMPEKERLLYRLMRAHYDSTFEHFSREEALRLADEALARFPEDKYAIVSAANAYEAFDQPGRWEPALRRALALDPGYYWAAAVLAHWRTADALDVAKKAVATRRSPGNLSILARALWATGDEDGAVAVAREVLGGEGRRHSALASRVCMVLREKGLGKDCLPVWTRMADEGLNEHERDFARARLMDGLVHQGRIREALRLARTNPEFIRVVSPIWLADILQVGRPRTDAPEALEAARRIPNPQIRRNYLTWLGAGEEADRITTSLEGKGYELVEKNNRAMRLLNHGQPAEAASLFSEVREEAHRRNYSNSWFGVARAHAEALLAAGRPREAAEIWPATLPCRCTYILDHANHYPSLALTRARAMEQLGRRADAIRELDGVLAFWKEADADLPLLVEAKAMRKRLAAQPTAGTAVKAPAPAATKAKPTTPSIAVLPFTDMSPGKDQEYFADGVAEEILNALTRVEGLKVIGRTSSFSFKGKSDDLRSIGRRLGAATLLEGSVRRDGERLRITVRLVNAEDAARIWSEMFDRPAGDVFAVQDEVARAVAEGLRVRLVASGSPKGGRTEIPEAHAELLRGRHLARQLNEADMRLAISALEHAVALDPGYALAHAELSRAFLDFPSTVSSNPQRTTALAERDAAQARARASAERAIALAPDLPAGWSARAAVRAYAFDFDGARSDLDRALALGARGVEARAGRAHLLAILGRLEEALREARGVVADDPLATLQTWYLASFLNATGRHDLARRALVPALEAFPQNLRLLRELCFTELYEGHPAAALALSERSSVWWVRRTVEALAHHDLGDDSASRRAIAELEPRGDRLSYQLAEVYAWRGELDQAFGWLDRALEVRDEGLRYVKYDPLLRKLRGDPRYAAFLRRMNLPVD